MTQHLQITQQLKEDFAKRLKEAMAAKDVNYTTLAHMIGSTHSTISRYAAAQIEPGLTMIIAMANALKVSPAWLLTGDTTKQSPKLTVSFKVENGDLKSAILEVLDGL